MLFPAAGLDPARRREYYDVLELVDQLSYAGNEAARRYSTARSTRQGAADWLERYGLYSPPRAEQRVRFIDQYRSYVINYNLGQGPGGALRRVAIERRARDRRDAAGTCSRSCSRRRGCHRGSLTSQLHR